MISVGSRDGRKGIGLGIDVGKEMDETELEEGEASCYQNGDESTIDPDVALSYILWRHLEMDETELEEGEASCYQNGDESTIDLDVALSYIDEKLQDVLGHFQKDFEGGVSAEKLGAKFGGYGSFLPAYQRSPACFLPRTSPKDHIGNTPRSPNFVHLEGVRHNSVVSSNASVSATHGLASASSVLLPPVRVSSVKDLVNQDLCMSSAHCADVPISTCELMTNSANPSDQRTLKVRIKVGSDNLSTQKNAEIYSGLGLDVSPCSSWDGCPIGSHRFSHSVRNPEDQIQMASDDGLLPMGKYGSVDLLKKRKVNACQETQIYPGSLPIAGHHLQDSRDFTEGTSENDHREEKKVRISKSEGKETSIGKGNARTDKKGRRMKNQHGPDLGITQSQQNLDAMDSFKRDLESVRPSLAATSSSSKVSGSHKNRATLQEEKGSLVESVSSSPLRMSNPDKFTSSRRDLDDKDDSRDVGFFAMASPRRCSDGENDGRNGSGIVRKDESFTASHHGSLGSSVPDMLALRNYLDLSLS